MPRPKKSTPDPPPAVDPGDLMNKVQVADKLGVSTRKLDKMIAAGEFPAGSYALGRSPRWTTAGVNEWINAAFAAA